MDTLELTTKELFYTAALLGLGRLVNVIYDYPAEEQQRVRELSEVKRELHRRKLLRENSKGEVTLDYALAACAAFCAEPESCETADGGRTIYSAAGAYMLLEQDDCKCQARWFETRAALEEYMEREARRG